MTKSHHSPNEQRVFPSRRYAERRHWLDSIKIASGCVECGLWGPPEALTFDHVRGEKKFGVGTSWNQGRAALEEEIAKCEIVCCNCHATRTKTRAKDKKAGLPPFVPFPKIPRLFRECVVTEKLDGTSAAVWVDGDGDVWPASRNRWITEDEDNFGFAAWVASHADEFSGLGPCVLHGEWWGSGINRGYGLKNRERFFSLFNTSVWDDDGVRPACCRVVPTLYRGPFNYNAIETALEDLGDLGSVAMPGYMDPEGIVVYHTAANQLFKKTLKDDEKAKGAQE